MQPVQAVVYVPPPQVGLQGSLDVRSGQTPLAGRRQGGGRAALLSSLGLPSWPPP